MIRTIRTIRTIRSLNRFPAAAPALVGGLLAAAPASAAAPKIFMHLEGFGTMPCIGANAGTACALPKAYNVLLPHIAGAQLYVPWSAVQTTSATSFNWTALENVIRPWAQAGKQVGISFLAVENTAGVDQTGISALPAFLLSPPPGTPGPRLITCRLTASGQSWTPPTDPVWWDPLYSTPWKAFGAAAIEHFAHRSDIAYLRFGEGQSDESMVQVTKTLGLGQATPTSQAACNSLWNQADAVIGKQGVFADQVGAASSLVASLGAVARRTPGAPPIFGAFNDMGSFQQKQTPSPQPYADRLAAAQAQAGVIPGNEGFGSESDGNAPYSTKFGGVYGWTDPWFAQNHVAKPAAFFMQTSSPTLLGTYTTMPQILENAMRLGIGTFELYSKDLYAMFDPTNSSGHNPYTGTSPSPTCLADQVTTVLAGLAIPSCH